MLNRGRMPCAECNDKDHQKAYYEGYGGNEEITKIFVFTNFGKIVHSGVTFPGRWHDSKVFLSSGLLLDHLSDGKTPRGKSILGDSAFVIKTGVINGKFLRGRRQWKRRICLCLIVSRTLQATLDAIDFN